MKKKLLLTIGSLAAVATPIVAVVSCGSEESDDTTKREDEGSLLEDIKDGVENLWKRYQRRRWRSCGWRRRRSWRS